jgi:hypothetical protein
MNKNTPYDGKRNELDDGMGSDGRQDQDQDMSKETSQSGFLNARASAVAIRCRHGSDVQP